MSKPKPPERPKMVKTQCPPKRTTQLVAPTPSLTFSGRGLKLSNNGPITVSFSPEMVRRLFHLVPHPSLIWYGQRTLTAFDILQKLTPASLESFHKVLKQSPTLADEYKAKVQSFAAYAYPKTGEWPDDDDSVLEVVPLAMPYIKALSCYIDGSLRFSCDCNDSAGFRLLTDAEFHIAKGQSATTYLTTMLPLTLEAGQHVMELLNTKTLTQVDVTYADENNRIASRRITYRTPIQLEFFLNRHHCTPLETTVVQTAPEGK